MPANLVFRRKIWGARDNGIPPRSTPGLYDVDKTVMIISYQLLCHILYLYIHDIAFGALFIGVD